MIDSENQTYILSGEIDQTEAIKIMQSERRKK